MTLVFWPAEGDERSEAAEVKGRGAPAATVRSRADRWLHLPYRTITVGQWACRAQ